MATEEITRYYNDTGQCIGVEVTRRSGPGNERGYWELLILLPFIGMMYYIHRVISS